MSTGRVASFLQQLSLFDEAAPAQGHESAARPAAGGSAGGSAGGVAGRAAGASTVPAPAEFRHPRSQREIDLGAHRVAYEMRRSRRRSIGFVVGPDGLSVSAPRWVAQGDIDAALREKAAWVLRKLQEQRERSQRLVAARVDWREGTTLPYLGDKLVLVLDPRVHGAELRRADSTLPGVAALTLHLGLPQSAAPEQIRDTVQSWLQRQARRVFEERCALLAPRLGVRLKRLALSSAATRWGSASANGHVRLNWRLIHFALPVIDYVVTHELAHLREMNHSPAFWDVVRTAMPDFEAARGALRTELLPVFD